MTENEKIELFDKWYDENYDEWAEGEEGIALREELEQAFKGGIAELEKENAELKADFIKSCNVKEQGFREAEQALERKDEQLTKAKEYMKLLLMNCVGVYESTGKTVAEIQEEAEQFLNSEVEK